MIRTILVTGISSGIGKSIVQKLSYDKDNIIVGIGRRNIENPPKKNFTFIECDIACENSVLAVASKIRDIEIDVFVNNAGAATRGTIEDMSLAEIKTDYDINLFSPLILLKSAIPCLRKNYGFIINIGALGSIIDTPTIGIYASAKLAYAKILDLIEMESNIKVFNIYIGAVKSSFGKNIINCKEFETSKYTKIYNEWQNRYKYFFKGRVSPEKVAEIVEKILLTKKPNEFVLKRDRLLVYCKRFLSQRAYKKVLFYYYKNDET